MSIITISSQSELYFRTAAWNQRLMSFWMSAEPSYFDIRNVVQGKKPARERSQSEDVAFKGALRRSSSSSQSSLDISSRVQVLAVIAWRKEMHNGLLDGIERSQSGIWVWLNQLSVETWRYWSKNLFCSSKMWPMYTKRHTYIICIWN